MFSITCPHCKEANQVDDSRLGQEVRCALCRKGFVIKLRAAEQPPSREASTARIEAIQAKTPPIAAGASITEAAPLAVGRGQRPAEDELPPLRRRPRSRDFDDRSSGSSNTGLIVGLAVVGVVFVGGLLTVLIYFLLRSDEPVVAVQKQAQAKAGQQPALNQDQDDVFAPAGVVLDPTRADHFRFMMAELKSDDEVLRHRAYEWLKQAKPDHPRRAEVCKILEERVPIYRAMVFGDDQFFEAYFTWASRDNYPWLSNMARNEDFTVWGNARRHRSMMVMAKLKDERGVEDIARNLENIHHQGAAFQALLVMGPACEKGLLPLLTDPNAGLRAQVVRVLENVGTPASLNALDEAARRYAQDQGFVQAVGNARRAIQARGK
jgi:hypothetical protein